MCKLPPSVITATKRKAAIPFTQLCSCHPPPPPPAPPPPPPRCQRAGPPPHHSHPLARAPRSKTACAARRSGPAGCAMPACDCRAACQHPAPACGPVLGMEDGSTTVSSLQQRWLIPLRAGQAGTAATRSAAHDSWAAGLEVVDSSLTSFTTGSTRRRSPPLRPFCSVRMQRGPRSRARCVLLHKRRCSGAEQWRRCRHRCSWPLGSLLHTLLSPAHPGPPRRWRSPSGACAPWLQLSALPGALRLDHPLPAYTMQPSGNGGRPPSAAGSKAGQCPRAAAGSSVTA